MIKDAITDIFNYIWPMMVIVITIIASLRIFNIISNKQKFKLYEELINLSFIIYILSLFYLVTFQDVNYGMSNFTPFKEMFRYSFGSKLFIKNVLGNILLFIPLGFYAKYYIKPKNMIFPSIVLLLSSITIEFTQLQIGRTFDIDDIILNVSGGLIGYLLSHLAEKLPAFTKKTWFLNIVTILIVVIFVLYLLEIYNVTDFNLGWLFWIDMK